MDPRRVFAAVVAHDAGLRAVVVVCAVQAVLSRMQCIV
ncbi:hypothetical protein XaFJ1_GM000138 [Xanthomonas albilineans]|nr:hypothetical protein XaFJ1_GM000138 [Xanthomonas albilineans]